MPLDQTEISLPCPRFEWKDGGHLRHCTFIGMCDDKNAAAVVRATPTAGGRLT
jgi:hypothetical protein